MMNKKEIKKQQSIIPEENESQCLSPIHRNDDDAEKSFIVQTLIDSIEKINITPVQTVNKYFINQELEKKVAQYEKQLQFDKILQHSPIKKTVIPAKQQKSLSEQILSKNKYCSNQRNSSNQSSIYNYSIDTNDISSKLKTSFSTLSQSPQRKIFDSPLLKNIFLNQNVNGINNIQMDQFSDILMKLKQQKSKYCRCSSQYKLIESQQIQIQLEQKQLRKEKNKNKLIHKLENIRRSQKQIKPDQSHIIKYFQEIKCDDEHIIETIQPTVDHNTIQYKLQNELKQMYENYLNCQIIQKKFEIQETLQKNDQSQSDNIQDKYDKIYNKKYKIQDKNDKIYEKNDKIQYKYDKNYDNNKYQDKNDKCKDKNDKYKDKNDKYQDKNDKYYDKNHIQQDKNEQKQDSKFNKQNKFLDNQHIDDQLFQVKKQIQYKKQTNENVNKDNDLKRNQKQKYYLDGKQQYYSKKQLEQKEKEELELQIQQKKKLELVLEITKQYDLEQKEIKSEFQKKIEKFLNQTIISKKFEESDLKKQLEIMNMKIEILSQDTINSIKS